MAAAFCDINRQVSKPLPERLLHDFWGKRRDIVPSQKSQRWHWHARHLGSEAGLGPHIQKFQECGR